MGDRKPSIFLALIQNLAGNINIEVILKSIRLSRLPRHIQIAVASQHANTPLEQLAQVADQVHEVTRAPGVDFTSSRYHPRRRRHLQQTLKHIEHHRREFKASTFKPIPTTSL